MENNVNAIIAAFVTQFVTPIVKAEIDKHMLQVNETLRETVGTALSAADWMRDLVTETVRDSVSTSDVHDAVKAEMDHYDFEDDLRHAIERHDFSQDVYEAVRDHDFSTDIEAALENYDFSDEIENAVDSALEERDLSNTSSNTSSNNEMKELNEKIATLLRNLADTLSATK
jgi:hypothetical protein